MNHTAEEYDNLARGHLLSTLRSGRSISFRVRGKSMKPWVLDGDVVEVEPASRISTGDVVLVEDGPILRVHRVIGCEPEGVRTAGDRLKTADPPALWNQVLGKVHRIRRDGRVVHSPLHPVFGRLWAALYPLRSRLFPFLRPFKRLAHS